MAFQAIHRLFNDRRGGVTTVFALTLPIIAFAIGAAVDFGRAAAGPHQDERRGGRRRARRSYADDAAAKRERRADSRREYVQWPDQRHNRARAGADDGERDHRKPERQRPDPERHRLLQFGDANNVRWRSRGPDSWGSAIARPRSAQMPPNIDFYLLLDNSPSMSLPATTAGITQMESLTSKQATGGCAFACHQASTNNGDTAGNPCTNGTAPTQSSGLYCAASQGAQIDNYQLARNNGITLRLDELNSAVGTLMQTAYSTANSAQFATPPTYRFSIYSMDSLWSIGLNQLMPLTTNYVAGWTSASANFGVMEMYSNNNDCANAACSSGTTTPGGDVATNYDDSLGKLSQASYIPNPGNGTNQSGDKPQEVLFIVTDGVEDEENGGRLQQAINDLGNAPGGNSAGTNWCTTIKNRGIKIAILYTDYLPVTANSWYNSYIAPIQTDIGPALQACASPGLFYDAAIGADLGQALSALFQAVVQNGHLTN